MEAYAIIFEEKSTGDETQLKEAFSKEKLEKLWPEIRDRVDENSE